MDLVTLASVATRQALKAAVPNIRRNSVALILSITSTLSLLGATVTIFSSDYLSRTNREFATKICLFLTGVSTAVTLHLIDKGINGLPLQSPTLKEGEFTEPRQSYQINIENYSGNLIDGNVSSDLLRNNSELLLNKSSNPLELPISSISEVVVIEPRSFEEVSDAVRSIQEGKSVVLNLTILDSDAAQRAVDFVAGGTYGMKGNQERIGESIFLFTPEIVQVSSSVVLEREKYSLSSSDPTLSADSRPRLRLLEFAQKEESGKAHGDSG